MQQFLDILTQRINDDFLEALKIEPVLQKWEEKIGLLRLDPYSASEQVVDFIREARELVRATSGGSPKKDLERGAESISCHLQDFKNMNV